MGRKRLGKENKYGNKHCSSYKRGCRNKVDTNSQDNYCKSCRDEINRLARLKARSEYSVGYFIYLFRNNKEVLYIGLSEMYERRLKEHFQLTQKATRTFIEANSWTDVVLMNFTKDILSRQELEYIEYKLIQFYKDRCKLTNTDKINTKEYKNITEERKKELTELIKKIIKDTKKITVICKNDNKKNLSS